MSQRPGQIAVVVPARDEQERLPRCLAGLDSARHHLQVCQVDPPVVRVVVVLDRCRDGTGQIAANWPGVEVLACAAGRVGAARAAGIAMVLQGTDPATVWIACTDADSLVPVNWLVTQLRAAESGAHVLLGTVRPDPAELPGPVLRRWVAAHDLTDGHRHIHGANLGIRGDVYIRVGGFPAVAAHEDALLVERVRAAGGRIVGTAASPVLTSARVIGRAPTGMATYLQQLNNPPELPPLNGYVTPRRELDAAVAGLHAVGELPWPG